MSLSIQAQDSVAVAGSPDIEYSFSRKTYEIAGITVSGADSYEDFVIIGFSGLDVGDKIEIPGDKITKAILNYERALKLSPSMDSWASMPSLPSARAANGMSQP